MNIAISGATGFIGTYLSAYFIRKGHQVTPLKREVFQDDKILMQTVKPCEIVVNLAGAPINYRWNNAYKKELYESRVLTTRKIVHALNTLGKPRTLISASAIGYYPDKECHDEYSALRGSGFLADLCYEWEREAHQVSPDIQLAVTRFGIVLSPEGGAFKQMIRPVKAGIAAILGDSANYFSWIDIKDLARAMEFIINNKLSGTFNLTAPQKLTQQEFAKQIAAHYHTHITIQIPEIVFRLLYGEGAGALTQGHCVYPKRLTDSGFQFASPDIEQFLLNR